MKNSNPNNLEKIFTLIESGVDPEKVLTMLPDEKKSIQEIAFVISSIQKEREKINAPKKILEKIFQKKEFIDEKNGRFSILETLYNLIINNSKIMNQKSKISIAILGIFALLIVGIIIFGSSRNNSEEATNPNQNETKKTDPIIATTSAVTGDQEIDSSVNSILNDALSEDDLNEELADINLALSDEEEINQINNLFNDNEL